MTFVTAAFTLAGFCFLFGLIAAWAGYKSGGVSRSLLTTFAVAFLFLSLFSVLVGTGFAVELTNEADCENVINSTIVSGNVTSYTYVDSCSGSSTPESIERLYQAYALVLLAVILLSVFAVLFLGLKVVLFKW